MLKDATGYQAEALRTAPRGPAYPEGISGPGAEVFDQMIWAMGLAGEAGEVADYLKKVFGHGHPLDREKVRKELGDVRWYGAVLAAAFDFTEEEIEQANVAKLRARYPLGFTVAGSLERKDLETERAAAMDRVVAGAASVEDVAMAGLPIADPPYSAPAERFVAGEEAGTLLKTVREKIRAAGGDPDAFVTLPTPLSRVEELRAAKIDQVAQRLFDVYNEQGPNPWKTFDGRPVPRWPELNDQVRAKWRAVAEESVALGAKP